MPLAAHHVAGMEVGHIRADRDDFADELMANHHRHGNRPPGPVVPLVNMNIGATDAGAIHLDKDIVDTDFRLRYLDQR